MHYIRKLPLILALAGAIITGFIGRVSGLPDRENIFRMTIVMIMFFITGSIIRNTVTGIIDDIRKKQTEEEQANKKTKGKTESQEDSKDKGQNLDITVNDTLEFNDEMLDNVEAFIKNELNKE